MLPEEKARVKIDKQLRNAGWDIVARNEYLSNSISAVKEARRREENRQRKEQEIRLV
ncbi:MAG: hypothetical protein J6C84_04270 [Lachnospiraceae bacterium]|nr:hypothetical protein [Lachnospiraceae bacterium]